ncbi:biopolymer transporter ExbD [Myxococcota bacterium]|nr:biopolymer transporter ExbD [Myxococcota bacterium]
MAGSFGADDGEGDGAIIAEINVTPLTDVFLVLLIIFMVTTTVIQNQSKNVDLPGADVSDTTPQGVTVTVTLDGTMLINDVPTDDGRLFDDLSAALEQAREKLVILRGDKQVLLGRAVRILDVAQQAGAKGIALATQRLSEES